MPMQHILRPQDKVVPAQPIQDAEGLSIGYEGTWSLRVWDED